MKKLKQNIKQMKNEVIEADLNTKINTVITMIGENMERNEDYRSILNAQGKTMEAYALKEVHQENYVLMAVLNSILKDVNYMNEEILTYHDRALDELDKTNASSENFGEESLNA
ncbi:hypothetical protein [Staphylococcus epidermidis]|uniref:hypothetical protein n=1 Tax=Staphylococcus epidermidis TaxID=1282 RepID=UPI00029910C6|nr:hypothetical protein [Staphylococcus epidermidis]EKS27331.1 hypothetical protein HMPREF9281_01911 [Staphylococcus epidermidis BVS058A4]